MIIGPVLGVSRSPDFDEIFEPLRPDYADPPFTDNAAPRVRRAQHYECAQRPLRPRRWRITGARRRRRPSVNRRNCPPTLDAQLTVR